MVGGLEDSLRILQDVNMHEYFSQPEILLVYCQLTEFLPFFYESPPILYFS